MTAADVEGPFKTAANAIANLDMFHEKTAGKAVGEAEDKKTSSHVMDVVIPGYIVAHTSAKFIVNLAMTVYPKYKSSLPCLLLDVLLQV